MLTIKKIIKIITDRRATNAAAAAAVVAAAAAAAGAAILVSSRVYFCLFLTKSKIHIFLSQIDFLVF